MDDLTMFAELRPDDYLTAADLRAMRAELFPSLVQPHAQPLNAAVDGHGDTGDVDVVVVPFRAGGGRAMQSGRRPRSRVAVAAAALVAVGVGGLWVAADRQGVPESTAPVAQPPSTAVAVPDLVPGVDDMPTEPLASVPTASLPDPMASATCATGSPTAVLPLVVGMTFDEATATLEQAGFTTEGLFENSPAGTANGDDPVVNQLATGYPAPGEPATCGAAIRLAVALLPGRFQVVQDGDTYPAIAEAEGIDVDELLSFNGLTRDSLASEGRTIDSPLMAGQAVSLEWSITAIPGPFCSDKPDDLTASQRDALAIVLEGRTQTEVITQISTDWCGGQLTQDQVRNLLASQVAG